MLYLAVVPGRSCTTFTPTETVESAWVTWANSGAYDAKSDWQSQPGVYPRSYVRASSRLNYVPPSASAAATHLSKGQNWKIQGVSLRNAGSFGYQWGRSPRNLRAPWCCQAMFLMAAAMLVAPLSRRMFNAALRSAAITCGAAPHRT